MHKLEDKVLTCGWLGVQASLQIQQAARNVLEENMYVRGCRLCFCPGILKVGDQREEEGGAGRLSLSSEAICLQEKLERYGSCPRVVGGDKNRTASGERSVDATSSVAEEHV